MEELLPKDNEKIPLLDGDELKRSEPHGFAPELMVRCEQCLRANPPTRPDCLYCSSPLPLNETTAELQRPTLRRLEDWESGYNNILVTKTVESASEATLVEAASLLKTSIDALTRIISAPKPLPLARTATRDEADLVRKRLVPLGLRTEVVSDEELTANVSVEARVRSIQIEGDGLRAFELMGSNDLQARWDQLSLLVTGRLITKRVEIQERRGTTENEIMNASELFNDEEVLDLYLKNNQVWRMLAHNFDFSFLRERKSLIAGENFGALLELLRKRATRAEFDDSYNLLRSTLDIVWPCVQKLQSRGWRRDRPGKYSIEAATQTNNEPQFTRYSRLRYYLRKNQLD